MNILKNIFTNILFVMVISAQLFILQEKIYGDEGEKILVMGFESRVINDIQDRLLREILMKKLKDLDYRVVPVMSIEPVIQKFGNKAIRTRNYDKMKMMCNRFKVDYSLAGNILPLKKGDFAHSIKSGRGYRCNIRIYIKKKDRYYNLSIKMKGKTNLHHYFNHLTDEISKSVHQLIKYQ